jgi:hypothetical protein
MEGAAEVSEEVTGSVRKLPASPVRDYNEDIMAKLTKWQYGLAYYNTEGVIEAHGEYMNDMQGLGQQSIAHFLEIAGEKGWEMCTLLPGKTTAMLVFKRPC